MSKVAIYAVKVPAVCRVERNGKVIVFRASSTDQHEAINTEKVLICSGRDPERSFLEHQSKLRHKQHSNIRLQHAFIGVNKLDLEILEWCGRHEVEARTNHWIETFGPAMIVNPKNEKEIEDDRCAAEVTRLMDSIQTKKQRAEAKRTIEFEDLIDWDLQWRKPATVDEFAAATRDFLVGLKSPEGKAGLKMLRAERLAEEAFESTPEGKAAKAAKLEQMMDKM